ncbi:MAG: ComEA family DNA-binding protein [Jatrophihabitantaceae bacterium]
MQRRYEGQGAGRLAGLAGLVGRLLGSPVAARLGTLEPVESSLAGARCNPGRRGVLAMAVVTAVTVLVAGGWVLAARPRPMLAADSTSAGSSAAPSPTPLAPGGSLKSPLAGPGAPAAAATGSPPVVVDVAGKVRKPGVYRLPPGSRVDDAVRAAGGLLGGVDPVLVNLARKLTDGEQLLVGLVAPAGGGPGSDAGSGAAPAGPGTATAGPLDLNTATLAQLDGLSGVGPVLAQRILDWRAEHGRFDSVEQLRGVSGIGDSKYADLKTLVTVLR